MAKHEVCFVDSRRKKVLVTKVTHVPMMGDLIWFGDHCRRVETVVYRTNLNVWSQPYVYLSDSTHFESKLYPVPSDEFVRTDSAAEF